jgi:hypothetical protein
MIDQQQPSPTLPLEYSTPPKPRRTWLYALIGGLAVLALALAGVGYFFVLPHFQAQHAIPRMMGADTQIYASLTPNLSAVPGIQRLQAAYPQLFLEQDSASADKQLEETLGVNFKDDIQPWLGTELAIAVSGIKDVALGDGPQDSQAAEQLANQAKITITVAARDRTKAQTFLDKQRDARTAKGQVFDQSSYKNVTIYEQKSADHSPIAAFAIVQSYVVFASDKDAIAAMIDRDASGKDTLEDNPRFKTVLANLSKTAVGYAYADGPALDQVIESAVGQLLKNMPAGQSDQLRTLLKNLQAIQGMGISVSMMDTGMQFDTAASLDVTKLDARTTAQFDAARTPVDTAHLQAISRDALGLLTFKIPATFKDQIMDVFKGQKEIEQSIKHMESQFDISLEHDLLDWFVGDAALVFLPGEKIGATTIPATGYFILQPQDKAAAEAGMKKIAGAIEQALGSEDIAFEPEQIAGVDWKVVKEPESKQSLAGYGFAKDDLVIAFGATALKAVGTGHDTPVTEDADFKVVGGKLISPNNGVFYLSMDHTLQMLRGSSFQADLSDNSSAAKALKPIKAIGASGSPGLDKDGISRARMFIYIGDK